MRMRLIALTLVLLFLTNHNSIGQSAFGGHPFQVKWNMINTDQVRVIYPDSLEAKAQRVANIIHYINDNNVGLLGEKRKKVDIILQNQQAISNGFAQVAPYKSEFFMQAPQDTYEETSVDWTDQLALHEYRHLNQFVNQKRGIGHFISWIFGDYGWGAMIGISAPAWFLEGDATMYETALSNGGRGRIPSFSVFQRAMLDEDVRYSHMKAMNGSYKDYVPNHYNTGYLICSEIRRTHGNDSWDVMTKRAARLNGIFYPFSKAIRKETGKKVREHLSNAQDKLESAIPDTDFQSKSITETEKRNVANYDFPQFHDGDLYFNYTSRRELWGIYKMNEVGEKELVVKQGRPLDQYFSKNGDLFVWSELLRDIRRGNQNYSMIVLYDNTSKKKRFIGKNKRYFTPSFTPDGKNIIFVTGSPEGRSSIAMYNLDSNAQLDVVHSKEIQYIYPTVSADGKSIFSIVKKGQEFALAKISINDGDMEILREWGVTVYGPLKESDGHLIFHANIEDRDNIYALDLTNKQIKQVSDDPIGLYNPSNYAEGKMVAVRPSSRGFMLHEFETSPDKWKGIASPRMSRIPYYLETNHLEGRDILSEVPDQVFETAKYPGTAKIFNPHSWYLLTDGSDFSANLVSTNVLNNIIIEPSYTYNFNLQANFADIGISYGKWFPVYTLNYSHAFPRTQVIGSEGREFRVSQQAFSPGINIPLTLTRGRYSSAMNLNNSISFQATQIQEIETQEDFNQNATIVNNLIAYRRTRFRPQQNYYPRWGINSLVFNRFRTEDGHNSFLIRNDFYVPGFHINHGFKFELDFTTRNASAEDRPELVDNFNYAQGFRRVDHDNIISFNTNYGFPVAYPDWGFWDFIYFKRINSVLFHNYNRVDFQNDITNLQSIGGDVLFDLVFINNVFSEITVGIRNAYMMGPLPEGKSNRYHFQFVFDIPAF